jgi:hypothetical protein
VLPRVYHPLSTAAGFVSAAAICVLLTGCRSASAAGDASIEITHIPTAADGTPDQLERIEGRARGARNGERVVLYALSGVWWVQPFDNQPFTAIQPDFTWKNSTHPGSAYAALLVDSRYRPPATVNALPEKGGPVLAKVVIPGAPPKSSPATIQFSGYQWEIRETVSGENGTVNTDTPANAWVDRSGFLHLRVSKRADHWVSVAATLSRSLGYGSYKFVVRDVSQLEPAAVFALYTWDELGPPREMDIEISRWGEPQDKNAQFVIQPYVVPANTIRFDTPSGPLTYWMNWLPGGVAFKATRGSSFSGSPAAVAEHVFTSGVPSAGNERIHMNLYVYGNQRHPLQNEFEVVIEKFEFLP